MNFTFSSQQYGTTVEISFEATHIDQIREMFDQFLRGSGFHFEDEDEEPQRPVKSYTGGEPQYATDDRYTNEENSDTSEKRVHESDKSIHESWVGLTDKEISLVLDKNTWASGYASWGQFAKDIEAKLKERNT